MTYDVDYDDALEAALHNAQLAELERDGDPQRVQALAALSAAWCAIADQLVLHHDQDDVEPDEPPRLQAVPNGDPQPQVEADPQPEHEGAGGHVCGDCGRTFDTPQGLGGHRRIHNETGGTVTVHEGGCSVDGCDRPHRSRGWCNAHYQRWQKHGDVYADVPIGQAGGHTTPLEDRSGGDGDQVTVDESQGEEDTQAGRSETVTPSTNGTAAPGDIIRVIEQLDPPVETQSGGSLLIVACTGCGAWHEQPLDATPIAGLEDGWEDAAVLVDQAMHERLHDGCPGERITARLEPKIGSGGDVRSSWDVIRKQTATSGAAL